MKIVKARIIEVLAMVIAALLVTPTAGKRFRLGAPVSGGVMNDSQFAAKVQQIQEYWRAATGSADASTAGPFPQPAATGAARGIRVHARPVTAVRVLRRIMQVVFTIVPLIIIIATVGGIGPAWAAHLGHGERGTFTAFSKSRASVPVSSTSTSGVRPNFALTRSPSASRVPPRSAPPRTQ